MNNNDEQQKIDYAVFVSAITILFNVLLAGIKFVAGWLGHSTALISDAVHSLSDVLSTFIVIVGVKLAKSTEDSDHQYGHEKIECVAGIVLAVLLFITGLGIGWSGIENIYTKRYLNTVPPTNLALYAACLSLIIKELMFWYTLQAGKKIQSTALMADAWHHRSDALSSIGSLAGVLGAQWGFPICDPLASILICYFIGNVAWDIFKESSDKVIDKACDQKQFLEIHQFITVYPHIRRIDLLKTRQFASKIYIDVEIALDGQLSLYEAHAIAEGLHDALETQFSTVKHCMVHVNPYVMHAKKEHSQ